MTRGVGSWALVLGTIAWAAACPSAGPSESPERVDEPDLAGPSSTGEVQPAAEDGEDPPVELQGDGCERMCGGLHDCLLAERDSIFTPRQASALELDCLKKCTEPQPGPPDFRLAVCMDARTCAELLPCMRESWPTTEAPPDPEPHPKPSGSGCRIGCERLGQCFDAKPDEIDTCTEGCERKLDVPQMQAFAECVAVADCTKMLECMLTFPGAGSGSP